MGCRLPLRSAAKRNEGGSPVQFHSADQHQPTANWTSGNFNSVSKIPNIFDRPDKEFHLWHWEWTNRRRPPIRGATALPTTAWCGSESNAITSGKAVPGRRRAKPISSMTEMRSLPCDCSRYSWSGDFRRWPGSQAIFGNVGRSLPKDRVARSRLCPDGQSLSFADWDPGRELGGGNEVVAKRLHATL